MRTSKLVYTAAKCLVTAFSTLLDHLLLTESRYDLVLDRQFSLFAKDLVKLFVLGRGALVWLVLEFDLTLCDCIGKVLGCREYPGVPMRVYRLDLFVRELSNQITKAIRLLHYSRGA